MHSRIPRAFANAPRLRLEASSRSATEVDIITTTTLSIPRDCGWRLRHAHAFMAFTAFVGFIAFIAFIAVVISINVVASCSMRLFACSALFWPSRLYHLPSSNMSFSSSTLHGSRCATSAICINSLFRIAPHLP